MRRMLLVGVLAASIGWAVTSPTASASSHRFKGALPVSVTCDVSLTVKFSPKLTDITAGPDGGIWFTNILADPVGRSGS
jgi:hypothetical protein